METTLGSRTLVVGSSQQSHQQYPANWDAWDIANHERWQKEYFEARENPGTAEYLAALLTGPEHSCPHPMKLVAGTHSGIPKRLGFFQMTDEATSFIDTEKLCPSCYTTAVPDGFTVWSTWYKGGPVHQGQTEAEFYPPMYEAGFEGFERFIEVLDEHAANALASKQVTLPRRILMPQNAEAREAWRFLQEDTKPFYLDQLHLTNPWNPNAGDEHQQEQEDLRVSHENAAAYIGASKGILATGVGGAGVNSAAEQRILAERGVPLPAAFGKGVFGQASFEPDADDQLMAHQPYVGPVLEVPEEWPEYYKMPEEEKIDQAEEEMRGFKTGPTPDELTRRRGFPEPDEQESGGYGSGSSDYQRPEFSGLRQHSEQPASSDDTQDPRQEHTVERDDDLREEDHESGTEVSHLDERSDQQEEDVGSEADNSVENTDEWYESRSDHSWAGDSEALRGQDEDVGHEQDDDSTESEEEEDNLASEVYRFNRGLFGDVADEQDQLEGVDEDENEENIAEQSTFSHSEVDSDDLRYQARASTSESESGADDDSFPGSETASDEAGYFDVDDGLDEGSSKASDIVGQGGEYDDDSSDEDGDEDGEQEDESGNDEDDQNEDSDEDDDID